MRKPMHWAPEGYRDVVLLSADLQGYMDCLHARPLRHLLHHFKVRAACSATEMLPYRCSHFLTVYGGLLSSTDGLLHVSY